MWVNPPTGSWVTIADELPQRVRQTMGATKPMLTVSFNPKEFATVGVLPWATSFVAVCFVNIVILPLVNRHAQQLGISAVTSCICISTIPTAALLGMSKNRWPVIGTSMFPSPVFTRLGHYKLLPVWPVKTTTIWEDLGQ
jgi:hypothetical protein